MTAQEAKAKTLFNIQNYLQITFENVQKQIETAIEECSYSTAFSLESKHTNITNDLIDLLKQDGFTVEHFPTEFSVICGMIQEHLYINWR